MCSNTLIQQTAKLGKVARNPEEASIEHAKTDEDTALYRDPGESGGMVPRREEIDWDAAADKEELAQHLAQIPTRVGIKAKCVTAAIDDEADLARVLMSGGYLSGLSQQEVKRLLAAVKNAAGKENIEGSVQKVMDIMVDNQLKRAKDTLHQLEAIKGSKVDARGVEVQGQLDAAGQHISGYVYLTNPMAAWLPWDCSHWSIQPCP